MPPSRVRDIVDGTGEPRPPVATGMDRITNETDADGTDPPVNAKGQGLCPSGNSRVETRRRRILTF